MCVITTIVFESHFTLLIVIMVDREGHQGIQILEKQIGQCNHEIAEPSVRVLHHGPSSSDVQFRSESAKVSFHPEEQAHYPDEKICTEGKNVEECNLVSLFDRFMLPRL
jgi:hypothetical protein